MRIHKIKVSSICPSINMDFLREPLRPRKAKNVKGGTAVKEQPGGDPNLDCKW
jgi:hypothetical protein